MKLISEAQQDDTFNKQLGKIQSAIEVLETLVKKEGAGAFVSSQRNAMKVTLDDLQALTIKFNGK